MLEAAESAAGSGSGLEALHAAGALEQLAGKPEAQATLERYANQANNTESWVEFSRACDNQLCRFAALQKAIKLGPANREALWEQVEYYRERGQSERQHQLLQSILASSPNDFVARKCLAEMLLDEGRDQAALEQFESLERDFPGVLWVKREVAAAYERLGLLRRAMPLAGDAFADNSTGGVEQTLLIRLASATHDIPRLRSTYETVAQLNPGDGHATAQLALLRWRLGEVQSAGEMLRQAIAQDPGNKELLSAAVQLQADARADTGKDIPVEAAALPARLQKQLDWHRALRPLQDSDAEFLASPEQIAAQALASRNGGEPGSRRSSEVLSLVCIDRVADNGLATTRVQQFWRVGDDRAAQQLATRTIQYSPATQSLEVLDARLHKKDGRVLEGEDTGESAVADSRIAMYYDQRSREIHFPGSEPGDVIELDYRTSPLLSSNPYGDYFASLNVFRTACR